MPELPEVETSCRGIRPHLIQQIVTEIIIRQPKLRWPIPDTISQLIGQNIDDVCRRGKYLMLQTQSGTALIHLGMSGSLRIVNCQLTPQKHDHVDIVLKNGQCLRFTDPRRFGSLLWTQADPYQHFLLASLGPEPLTTEFNGHYLYTISHKRSVTIKQFIMDSKVVVGVGNIYANEALFMAGIHPERKVRDIRLKNYRILAEKIKQVLQAAIELGGTTLRNFQSSEGKPGYFKQQLFVYGRRGLNCQQCNNILQEIRIDQRSSVYCLHCQR